MQFLVTLVQLSFLLRAIWQNVEGLAKKPTSGTLDTIWEVTGTKLPVLPVPPGHPVSKQNADVRWPSGENATDQTVSVCPVNGPPVISPVVAFHTRIVRSSEPETMRWPSGENAKDWTGSVCPVNEPASVSPVVAFHTRIIIVRWQGPKTTRT